MVFYKSVGQTENGLEHSFVKHWLNSISLYVLIPLPSTCIKFTL